MNGALTLCHAGKDVRVIAACQIIPSCVPDAERNSNSPTALYSDNKMQVVLANPFDMVAEGNRNSPHALHSDHKMQVSFANPFDMVAEI
jgi:hypothetical protein